MKKNILIGLILAFTLLLSGCNNIDFTIIEYGDGSYKEIYTIAFSEQEFLNLGATSEQVSALKNGLVNKLVYFAGNNIVNGYFENEFYTRVDATEQSIIKRDELKNGFSCDAENAGNNYQLIFNYQSYEVYKYFHRITQEDIDASKENIETEQGFFTYRIVQKSKARFGAQIQRDDDTYTNLGTYIWEQTQASIAEIIEDEAFALRVTAPTYTYTYGTTSARLHSDADQVVLSNGFYFHIWKLNIANVEKEITFYTIEARREIWYALILVGIIVLVGVLAVINVIKNKVKKNNSDKIDKQDTEENIIPPEEIV